MQAYPKHPLESPPQHPLESPPQNSVSDRGIAINSASKTARNRIPESSNSFIASVIAELDKADEEGGGGNETEKRQPVNRETITSGAPDEWVATFADFYLSLNGVSLDFSRVKSLFLVPCEISMFLRFRANPTKN